MADSSAVVDSGRSSGWGHLRERGVSSAVTGGTLSLNTRTNRLLWLGVDVVQVPYCSVVNASWEREGELLQILLLCHRRKWTGQVNPCELPLRPASVPSE